MKFLELIKEDFAIVKIRDPATQSAFSVWTLHTGFWAVCFYRLEHALWTSGWRWLARFLSIFSRWLTGVEIHPAVKAGHRLFIDHGMGIVIGETAELGDDVSIYQGVTLGGTSWQAGKRHPTIGNNVIIGAGAKVIGAITVGDNSRIGSNAVVVKDVEPYNTMVGIPAKAVKNRQTDCEKFSAYGQDVNMPDPVREALETLNARICELEAEIKRLKS